MTADQIIQSWKDEDYSRSLNASGHGLLPENPAGLVELSDEELLGINGGALPISVVVTIIVVTATITL